MLKKLLLGLSLLSLVGSGCVQTAPAPTLAVEEPVLGTSDGSQWITYSAFTGYETKVDPEKVQDGSNPQGQNTSAFHGDRVGIREQGYGLFPSSATFNDTAGGVTSLHTFRKRDGSSILMRSATSTIEWYYASGTTWNTLSKGYTSADFGFADNNVNTDQQSYTYFGNAREAFSRWNGEFTFLTVAATSTATTLFVGSTANFATTGSLVVCNTTTTYLVTSPTTFAVTSTPACAVGEAVTNAVQTFDDQNAYPRGNIYLFADNRLWISGTTATQNIVYFSGYGTSTDFASTTLVTSSTFADPGLFNLAEGGGPVVAMVMDEGSEYIFKHSIIYKATLNDAAYSIVPLKSFDQKSQTTGASSKRSTFTSGNGVVFVTPDNQIMLLDRVDYIDYPQITPISDPIRPTVSDLTFTSSTGIVYRDKVYISAKTTADGASNDVTLVYNITEKFWDSPIVGWNVGDWSIFPDPTTLQDSLFFGDGVTDNVYEISDQPQDYIYDTASNWRSKAYTFGTAQGMKYVSDVFVEGYIAANTSITISLLCDEDGFTQRYTTTLAGTETSYLFNTGLFNLFGLKPFGTTRFGAQEDLSGKKKFRVYLGKDFRQVPCYSYQLEFGSDGSNQQWEVLNYAFAVRPLPQPENRLLYKSFK